jgi:hypothetical protein
MKTLLAIALLGYMAGGVSNAEAAATLQGRNKVLAECTRAGPGNLYRAIGGVFA